MEIEPPELTDFMSSRLTMFCREDRIVREMYWSGSGFQVWCQLLTHISRGKNSTILVVDEPEVYLHPDVQRQLVGILRDAGPDIVIASHSTEIIGESDPTEILVINKSKTSATRLKDISQVQAALDAIGSIHNVALTHLARTGRLLYVESSKDDKILRRFARILGFDGLAAGNGVTVIESEGFGSWKKIEAAAWAFEKALKGQFKIGVIFDRDYFSNEEIEKVLGKLATHFTPVHIHERKEIENYMLVLEPLDRAIEKALRDRARRTGYRASEDFDSAKELEAITDEYKDYVISQLVGKRVDFLRKTREDTAKVTTEVLKAVESMWGKLETRLTLVPGKEVLKRFRERLTASHSVNLTDIRIIDEFRPDEIPTDLRKLLVGLNEFSISQ